MCSLSRPVSTGSLELESEGPDSNTDSNTKGKGLRVVAPKFDEGEYQKQEAFYRKELELKKGVSLKEGVSLLWTSDILQPIGRIIRVEFNSYSTNCQ
jgi:hypothetical protein